MKKLLASLLLCFASAANAAPFLWAQIDQGADICVLTPHGTTVTQEFPVVTLAAGDIRPAGYPTGAIKVCKIDFASPTLAPVGNNNISLAVKSSVWGVLSSNVPFAFTRPGSTLPAPSSIQLVGGP